MRARIKRMLAARRDSQRKYDRELAERARRAGEPEDARWRAERDVRQLALEGIRASREEVGKIARSCARKRRYGTRRAALHGAERDARRYCARKRPYECAFCGGWHLATEMTL